MIKVLVEHFLNKPGIAFFPQGVSEVEQTLTNHHGFKSIEKLTILNDTSRNFLLLVLDDLASLRGWASSAARDHEMDKLTPYMLGQSKEPNV